MEAAAPPAPKPSPRLGRRPRDMLRALVVLMIPVALIVVLYRALGHETPPTFDTGPAYDAARSAHVYTVLVPTGLSGDWHIVSADYGGGTLRIGINGPHSAQLQIVESNTPSQTLLPAELGGTPRATGTQTLGNLSWTSYTTADPDEKALVQSVSGRTTVVHGKASEAELKTLAGSMK